MIGGIGRDQPVRRVLLIHFGQMGDAVMALPAARALAAWPPLLGAARPLGGLSPGSAEGQSAPGRAAVASGQARLVVLAARGPHAVFEMAGFEEVLAVTRGAWARQPWRALIGVPGLVARLRVGRFDLSVDLHSYKETNWLAYLAGVPHRVAMLRPTRSVPSLITLKPPPDDTEGRLVDRYCTVLEPLGIMVADRVPRLAVTAERGLEATIGICVGAGHAGRRWPGERFAAVARYARETLGARVVVFAGPEESEELLAPLAAVAGVEVRRGLDLRRLTAALAGCRLVVTNPTGPSHLAAAAGGRVLTLGEIAMFDPVAVEPGEVHVIRARERVANIPLDEVVAAVARLYPKA